MPPGMQAMCFSCFHEPDSHPWFHNPTFRAFVGFGLLFMFYLWRSEYGRACTQTSNHTKTGLSSTSYLPPFFHFSFHCCDPERPAWDILTHSVLILVWMHIPQRHRRQCECFLAMAENKDIEHRSRRGGGVRIRPPPLHRNIATSGGKG